MASAAVLPEKMTENLAQRSCPVSGTSPGAPLPECSTFHHKTAFAVPPPPPLTKGCYHPTSSTSTASSHLAGRMRTRRGFLTHPFNDFSLSTADQSQGTYCPALRFMPFLRQACTSQAWSTPAPVLQHSSHRPLLPGSFSHHVPSQSALLHPYWVTTAGEVAVSEFLYATE